MIENPVKENQEVYRLWFEYLRENKHYKIFCIWSLEYAVTPEEKRSSSLIPKELLQCEYLFSLPEVFKDWGIVYDVSWEDKLSDITGRIEQAETNDDPSKKIVEQGKLSSLYKATSLEELFMLHNFTIPRNYLSLAIPINAPIDDLMEQFRKIMLKKQEEVKGKPVKKRPLFPSPSRKLSESDIKNLRRYLEVYRLRDNRLSWKDAIKEIDPKNEIHLEATDYKVWRREVGNAKDIIENVGKGIFPGEYGQVKERKKRTTKKKSGSPVY